MKADVLTTVDGRGRCKWWARVSRRSKTPQSDKLRGRGDQLSLPSPPGFVLNLPHFHSVSVSRWTSRGKRGEGSRHLGVRRLSLSLSLGSFLIQSLLLLASLSFNSSLSCSLYFPSFTPFNFFFLPLLFFSISSSCLLCSFFLLLLISFFFLPLSSLPFILFYPL